MGARVQRPAARIATRGRPNATGGGGGAARKGRACGRARGGHARVVCGERERARARSTAARSALPRAGCRRRVEIASSRLDACRGDVSPANALEGARHVQVLKVLLRSPPLACVASGDDSAPRRASVAPRLLGGQTQVPAPRQHVEEASAARLAPASSRRRRVRRYGARSDNRTDKTGARPSGARSSVSAAAPPRGIGGGRGRDSRPLDVALQTSRQDDTRRAYSIWVKWARPRAGQGRTRRPRLRLRRAAASLLLPLFRF